MRKTLVFAGLILLFSPFCFAQKNVDFSGEIEWIDPAGSEWISPDLLCEGCINDPGKGDLPVRFFTFDIKGNYNQAEISIENIVVEPADASLLTSKQQAQIAGEFQITSEIKYGRNDKHLVVEAIPFRRNASGEIERLVSFDARTTHRYESVPQLRGGADNSVLAEGTWYKIAVGKDGIYRMDRNFLQSLGVDVENVNPNQINIYGNGGELLPFDNSEFRYDDLQVNDIMLFNQNNDESFDNTDYILFYGKGVEQWKYMDTNQNGLAGEPRFESVNHYYSDSAYYYLRVDDSFSHRAQYENTEGLIATQTATKFHDRQVVENDITNLNKSGRQFFGEHFDINLSYDFVFDTPNLSGDSALLHAQCVARSIGSGSDFLVSIGGAQLDIAMPSTGTSATSAVATINDSFIKVPLSGDQTSVNVTFVPGNATAEGWLDFLELNCVRNLEMAGTQMHFQNMDVFGADEVVEYQLGNATLVEYIMDVTDHVQPKLVDFAMNGETASFTVENDELREFIAFTGSNYLTPRAVGQMANQDLHGFEGVDMIVLSSPLLVEQSEELADIHREEGMNVEVVTPMLVYNEFSSGNPDVTGIKMFMKHLYEKAENEEDRLKYLLIMGDGSYSGNKSVNSIQSFAVITFQSENSLSPTSSYVSDDYFALLDDNEGESAGDELDIGVGRIPAESGEEASDYINKLKIYLSSNTTTDGSAYCLGDENASPYGTWRNEIVLVADDQDGNGSANESFHMSQSDQHADSIFKKFNDYNVVKIYLDAYQQESTPGGERYEAAAEAIKQKVQQGALIVQYTGHGGEKGWAHERVLDIPTIQDWTNLNRLPLFVTATCELARFDDPVFKSAGEVLVMNGLGGAIAMLTTTRIVFAGPNQDLAEAFYLVALDDINHDDLRLGDITRITKNDPGVPNSSNKRNFSLLGDPALKLAYPEFNVRTTHLNDVAITEVPDTIKSLEEVKVRGFVADLTGTMMSDFNGFVYPTVFDKKATINTLNNDDGIEYDFDVFNNIIYKGKASVINGEFEFRFVVPKDINYNFDAGRISYYAVAGNVDAHGHSEEFVIGGSAEGVELNSVGPEITLFMNDTTFVYGGITNSEPLILARVFDENGINTVGNGIGHDITATLDNQSNEQLVLNDFYEADLDTYQSGEVRYQLSSLTEGTHNLKLKVWDVHNNSSEAFTEFVVAADASMALDHVLNYPNPFTTRTEFFFEHNQPCDVLDVRIQVFTVGGKLVKTIEQQVESAGFRSEGIVWDGKDDFGDKIGRGVYVYKIDVRTPEGIHADAFEKLVILN